MKEDEMGMARNTHWTGLHTGFWFEKQKENDN
jgi:hypothetical protein